MRIVALVLLVACRSHQVPTAVPTAVKIAVVENATSVAGARYSAQINPATRVEVAFKVGGYVDSVASVTGMDGKARALQEGDPVHANMQLAAIRRADYGQRLAEAQAAYAQTKAQLDQTQMDLDRVEK